MEAVNDVLREARSPATGALNRMRSDEALIESFRSGDGAAFAVLYRRHRQRAFAICIAVAGSREDAEDAVQEAFTSLAAKLREPREHRLRPLLATIARNAAIDIARARRKEGRAAPSELVCDWTPDRRAEQRADLSDLIRSLRSLPEQQRIAIVMREMGGCSPRDIAATLGVDETAARHLIERARLALRARREALSLACAGVREMLATEADGRRRPAVVRRHLRSCATCREFRAGLRADARLLRALAPGGGVPLLWRLLGLERGAPPMPAPLAHDGMLAGLAKVAAAAVIALGVLEGAPRIVGVIAPERELGHRSLGAPGERSVEPLGPTPERRGAEPGPRAHPITRWAPAGSPASGPSDRPAEPPTRPERAAPDLPPGRAVPRPAAQRPEGETLSPLGLGGGPPAPAPPADSARPAQPPTVPVPSASPPPAAPAPGVEPDLDPPGMGPPGGPIEDIPEVNPGAVTDALPVGQGIS